MQSVDKDDFSRFIEEADAAQEALDEAKADWIEPHDCIDHLQLQQHEWTEPHGERYYQEWWECSKCGEKLTDDEVRELSNK